MKFAEYLKAMAMRGLLGVFLGNQGIAFAQVKCPPMPSAITESSRDIALDVKAGVGALGRVKLGELTVRVDAEAKALFAKYPNFDKTVALQIFAATYCQFLIEAKSLSEMERIQRWERFQERYLELQPGGPKISNSRVPNNGAAPPGPKPPVTGPSISTGQLGNNNIIALGSTITVGTPAAPAQIQTVNAHEESTRNRLAYYSAINLWLGLFDENNILPARASLVKGYLDQLDVSTDKPIPYYLSGENEYKIERLLEGIYPIAGALQSKPGQAGLYFILGNELMVLSIAQAQGANEERIRELQANANATINKLYFPTSLLMEKFNDVTQWRDAVHKYVLLSTAP